MSHDIRKPAFCICENKGTDQLCGNCTADQRIFFPLHRQYDPISSKIGNFKPLAIFSGCSLVCVGSGWKSRRQVFSESGSYNAEWPMVPFSELLKYDAACAQADQCLYNSLFL